jgi:ankyrin repeat protein
MEKSLEQQLFDAIRASDAAPVRALIAAGADVNCLLSSMNGKPVPLLFWAVKAGNTRIVNSLLKAGSVPNVQLDNGSTPLIMACRHNEDKMARSLIKAGADLNAQDDTGYTSLLISARGGFFDLVRLLLDAGANASIQSNDGKTLLAILPWHTNLLPFISEAFQLPISLDAKDSEGYTALINACMKGNVEAAKLLLSAGADFSLKNNEGETALMASVSSGEGALVKLLIEAGADLNIQNVDGYTALMLAANGAGTQADILKDLLEAGADWRIKNPYEADKTAEELGLTSLVASFILCSVREREVLVDVVTDSTPKPRPSGRARKI